MLFDYARRPTDEPALPRPCRASGALVLEPGAPTSERGLRRALSLQSVPSWHDCDAPDTGRPSAPTSDSDEPLLRLGPELTGTLTVVRGSRAGRVVSLKPGQTLIGRSPQADLHLVEHGVSRKHARVCCVGGGFVLEDLGSRNGTYLGGTTVNAAELNHGDVIRLGPLATVRFCWMDPHQKSLLEELYESSVRDVLTGAFNRRHFAECLRVEIAYARRHRSALSLLLLDVDHFKRINDEYGHPDGDRVLGDLSSVSQGQLRTEDVFARYGGEEFAALLRGVALPGAVHVAERLREAVSKQVSVGTPPSEVTISVGCASLACVDQASASELVQAADRRLYEAKRAGRNRVVATG